MRSINVLLAAFFLLICQAGYGGSATWTLNPTSGDWNTAANWTPATVPNGPADTATFSATNRSSVSLSVATEIDRIIFDAASTGYIIAPEPGTLLTISGAGVINNSAIVQAFIPANNQVGDYGVISFTNDATAGIETSFTNMSGTAEFGYGGEIQFADNANAGSATFLNSGGIVEDGYGGFIFFSDNSSAGDASFTSNGGDGYLASGGAIYFRDNATAGKATFVTNGGLTSRNSIGAFTWFSGSASAGDATLITNGGFNPGETLFIDSSTAGNATLIANGSPSDTYGGSIRIFHSSTGGTARVMLFGKGELNLSIRDTPEVVVGSIEGDGVVYGGHNLIVGSNNLSTTFSGVIQSGSLTKIGRGQLVLSGANTYDGPTGVMHGTLVVNNTSGSATGTGPVRVELGSLAGKGIVAGDVSVGTGAGKRAVLAPGLAGLGTLTIESTLSFASDGLYNWNVDSNQVKADQVSAHGVSIGSGASFSFRSRGNGTLSPGTVFTAISNTTSAPISGAFSNLADGSTITIGSNAFHANYEGGDGNDLTLTVVP